MSGLSARHAHFTIVHLGWRGGGHSVDIPDDSRLARGGLYHRPQACAPARTDGFWKGVTMFSPLSTVMLFVLTILFSLIDVAIDTAP
jgi:hypothetical protein